MKLGDFVQIENVNDGKVQRINGIVVKCYDDGKAFIRVTSSTGLYDRQTRGWGKYGVRENEGYYYNPEKYDHTTINILQDATKVYNYRTTVNKTITNIDTLSCSANSKDMYTTIVECPASDLTFVYLDDKEVGSWVKGVSPESIRLATYRCLIKYYSNLERNINLS